jgi:hypothetical protein
MKPLDILRRLQEHDGPRALSRRRVLLWAREVRLQRTNLANIPRPGRVPDECLEQLIARRHEEDLRLSARKLAESLRISAMTV